MSFWSKLLESPEETWLKEQIKQCRGGADIWAPPPGSDARSKLDKLAGVEMLPDVACAGCRRAPSRCTCNRKTGRPNRWFE